MKRKVRKIKRNKSKLLILLTFVFVCLFGLTFQKTYGLFESNKVEVFESNIAKWNINVNNINVTESTNFVIDKIILENNTSVKEGKMAPGTSGYFDILIDGSNTDVSFRYDIKFDFSKLDITNLMIDNIEEINFNKLIKTDEDTYTNVITLDEIRNNKNNLVRVYVKWQNAETSNEEDSMVGLDSDYSLSIPVSITFTQYLGEEIVEYIE